jgi:hypothetical protein
LTIKTEGCPARVTYLLKDRLAITGPCWSLPGAEAILLLRAAMTNGDFYRRTWRYVGLDPVEVQRVTEDWRPFDPCVRRPDVCGC